MVSREARSRFMIMSVLSVALGVIFVLMTYLPAIFDGKRQPLFLRAVVLVVAVPAITGGLCMFFGMEWYCLEVDTSRKTHQATPSFRHAVYSTIRSGHLLPLGLSTANPTGRNENHLTTARPRIASVN